MEGKRICRAWADVYRVIDARFILSYLWCPEIYIPAIYIPAIYIPEIRIPENNFPIIFILFKISLKRRKLRVGEQYCERKRDA